MIYLGTSGTKIFIDGNLPDFTGGRHFGPGRAEFTGRIISCGDSMEHYKEILGFSDWSVPDTEALKIEPGSEGLYVIPHLKQKGDDESTRKDMETIFGLESTHSPWHIYRSLLEGIAYNLRTSYESYETKVRRLILSGVGAKSRVFREIVRDVLGQEVYYNPEGNGAAGIALLAGNRIGCLSLQELSAALSEESDISKPDPDSVKIYSTCYRLYRKLQKSMDLLYVEKEKLNVN